MRWTRGYAGSMGRIESWEGERGHGLRRKRGYGLGWRWGYYRGYEGDELWVQGYEGEGRMEKRVQVRIKNVLWARMEKGLWDSMKRRIWEKMLGVWMEKGLMAEGYEAEKLWIEENGLWAKGSWREKERR